MGSALKLVKKKEGGEWEEQTACRSEMEKLGATLQDMGRGAGGGGGAAVAVWEG